MSSCMNGRKVLGLELVASDDLLAKYSKLEVAMMHTGRVETHHPRKHQKDTPSSRFLRMILSGGIAKSINASANELHQLDDNTSVSSRSISQVLKELDIKELAAQPTLSELDEVKVPQVMPSSGPLTFLNQINRLLCAENNCNMLDLTTDKDYNADSHSTLEESTNTTPDERAVKSTESNLLKSFTATLKWEVLERFMSVPVNDTNVVSSMSNNAATTTNQSNITTFPIEILINTVSNESDLNLSNKDDLLLSDADDVAEPDLLLTHLNSNLRCELYDKLLSMANDQDNNEDNHSLVLSTCEDRSVPLSADMPMIKSQSMDRDQSTSCKSYEGVNNKCPSEEEMKPTLKSYEVKKKKKKAMTVVGDVLRFVAKKRFNKPIKTDTIPEERASESQILVDNGREFLALFDNSGKAECHESDVCSAVVNLNDHLPGDAGMVTEKSRNVDDRCSTDSPASVERFPSSSPDMIDDHSLGTNRLRGAAMVDTNEVYDDYQCVQPTFKLTAGDRVAKVFLRMRSGRLEITDQSKEIQQDDMDDTLESTSYVNQKSSSSQSMESGGIISITCSTISSLNSATSSLPRQNNHATNTTTGVPSVVMCLTLPQNLFTRKNDTNPSVKYSKQGRRCVSFAELDEIAHYGTDEEATLITHESLASNSFLSLLEKFANDIMDKTFICEAEVEDDDDSTFSYDEN